MASASTPQPTDGPTRGRMFGRTSRSSATSERLQLRPVPTAADRAAGAPEDDAHRHPQGHAQGSAGQPKGGRAGGGTLWNRRPDRRSLMAAGAAARHARREHPSPQERGPSLTRKIHWWLVACGDYLCRITASAQLADPQGRSCSLPGRRCIGGHRSRDRGGSTARQSQPPPPCSLGLPAPDAAAATRLTQLLRGQQPREFGDRGQRKDRGLRGPSSAAAPTYSTIPRPWWQWDRRCSSPTEPRARGPRSPSSNPPRPRLRAEWLRLRPRRPHRHGRVGGRLRVGTWYNVVSEVNASTGFAVATFSGSKFAFSHPTSIAAWKGEVFVAWAGQQLGHSAFAAGHTVLCRLFPDGHSKSGFPPPTECPPNLPPPPVPGPLGGQPDHLNPTEVNVQDPRTPPGDHQRQPGQPRSPPSPTGTRKPGRAGRKTTPRWR